MHAEHSHDRQAIALRLAEKHKPSYVRDFVYGGIDGAITTFAIVAGVIGAEFSNKVILALGLANLVADGFSMAASNFSGVRAAVDELEQFASTEAAHIEQSPEGEREEVRQLLQAQGLSGPVREAAVQAITRDKKRWIEFMLSHEYGMSSIQPSPWRAAGATFLAFVICGFVPIAPFVFSLPDAELWSLFATAIVFISIGTLKSRWSIRSWWASGLETLFIGGFAAGVAYIIGVAMSSLVS